MRIKIANVLYDIPNNFLLAFTKAVMVSVNEISWR